jgi:hypothetical protein
MIVVRSREEARQILDRLNMFGISFWPDEGLMTHSLHTLLIEGNGVLTANLEGNKFTADQPGDLVKTVIDRPPAAVR